MANRKVPSVRPPRRPRGEDPKVTIGTLERQLSHMTQRVIDLAKERDEALKANSAANTTIAALQLCDKINRMEKADLRLLGWQDCARELIESLKLSKS